MNEREPSVVRESSLEEIEDHLLELGVGNQEDNIKNISSLPNVKSPNYYLLELSEEEFFSLVFLQNSEVLPIAPRDEDRRLEAVASRALQLLETASAQLSNNWDLESNYNRLIEMRSDRGSFTLPPLVLRDARDTESQYPEARWYIQDGCHRALAYAMGVLRGDVVYQSQLAFCATANTLHVAT